MAIGTLLATAYSFVACSFIGIPIEVQGAAAIAALYAVPIAAICALLWRAMISKGHQGCTDAAALGFVITLLAWVSTNYEGAESLGDVLCSGSPYAICGALAAVATWLVARPRSHRR